MDKFALRAIWQRRFQNLGLSLTAHLQTCKRYAGIENMESHRKTCFEQLRHKNACSIDELKFRLRKLYVQDLKVKREKILKDKRDIIISEEDDLDFFSKYCRNFFGRSEDPLDVDEDLLYQIWEEIRLEEIENAEANLVESLVSQCGSHEIVCPLCLKLPAQLDESHHLTCTCGLKFLLPSHIDLKDFEATLLTSNDIHSETCNATPVYEVRPTAENKLQFISSCESCLYFNTILETPV